MELSVLKKNLLNNSFLKLYALCVGYSIWSSLSTLVPTTCSFTVPLCFYGNSTGNTLLDAPEYVTIHLAAYKKDLYALTPESLAFHVNSDELTFGINRIPTTHNHLFLPDRYKLVHCNPAYITVSKQSKDSTHHAE